MGAKNYKRRKKKKKRLVLKLALLGILVLAVLIFLQVFTIKTVEIEGSEHYTDEELKDKLIDSIYTKNSLYFMWKTNAEDINIPFISELEIEMVSPSHIKIRVYEKNIVGYIEHLGMNMYFDKDGIIVESSQEAIEDVPLISGLDFKKLTLYEKLEVQKQEVFDVILNLTQMLDKSEIYPDKIFFDSKLEITLYFDKVKVLLGADENLEGKVSKLNSLLPELDGLSGTLYMENFTQDMKNITFKKDETLE